MSEPIIEALSVLDLREGDTLIVRLATVPSAQQADATKRLVRSQLTVDVPVLVVGPGTSFEIVRPANG